MNLLVSNIQRFSLHDGDGIRTVVFFMGCNLTCPWCANPENLCKVMQPYFDNKGQKAGTYGKYYSCSELEEEILKDSKYFINGGGVTYSGGEPLLYTNEILPLLSSLKEKKINQCIETALFAPINFVEKIVDFIDTFIIDIKILDKKLCKDVLGGDIKTYYDNLNFIFDKKKTVVFRIPAVSNYTFTQQNIKLIIELLKKYPPTKVELFGVHKLAKKKYESIKKTMPIFEAPKAEELDVFKEQVLNLNIDVHIIKVG